MQVKYPINTTANPSSEAALQELISKIRTESTGHYLISEGGRWHGGIHITEKSHPNHAFEPIQALADGELVAYRITEDYLQSTYQDQTLRYSNSFCLLRHQCPIPESENTFTFYSLYMHLRPLNAQPGCLYRVNNNRSIRRTANPTHTDANRKTLPAGSLIECPPDVPAEQHQLRESEGAIEYLFVKARTYNLDSGAGSESFWIALHEKNRPSFHTDGFEAQNTQPRWYPQPRITPPTDHGTREDLIPLPKIEQQPEIQLNQLVILDTPMPLGAGDALGYLGLHERLCRAGDGSTEHSYQIHLETFAIEPPPQVLFNTEHWRWMKKGEITDHEGNPQKNNTFFKDLVTSLDDNNDDHLSYREVQSAYHNKGTAKSLEHLISHHASEWQDDANRKQYKSWELYLGQVRAWIKGKKERKAFYERLQDNLRHEKERLTELKWLDTAQRRLGLSKDVWHMHPIRLVHQLQQHAREDEDSADWLIVPEGQFTFDVEGNDNPRSDYFSRVVHAPGGASGITLGRGYDLFQQYLRHSRDANKVVEDLTAAGISPELIELLRPAITLQGNPANDFYAVNRRPLRVYVITRKQQYDLYNRIYSAYKVIAKRRFNTVLPDESYDDLHEKIKDVLVDMNYRGDFKRLNINEGGEFYWDRELAENFGAALRSNNPENLARHFREFKDQWKKMEHWGLPRERTAARIWFLERGLPIPDNVSARVFPDGY